MTFSRYAFVVCGLVAAAIATVWWVAFGHRNTTASLEQARRDLRQGNSELALKIALDHLSKDPSSAGAKRIAAMAHAALGQPVEAAALFMTLPGQNVTARETLYSAAEKALELGQLSQSAALLRQCVKYFPSDAPSHRMLATILNSSGQRWDSCPHSKLAVAQKQFSLTELLLLGNPEEPFNDEQLLPAAAKLSPDDPLVMSGLAVSALRSDEINKAIRLLEQATAADATLLESSATLGGLLLDNSEHSRFISWNNSLPANAAEHSEIWFVWGRYAQSTRQYDAAARCYWESLLRAPESRKANFQLGQMLAQLNRADDAKPFLLRAEQLAELHQLMRPIYFDGPKATSIIRIAQLLESMGRQQEAMAWYFAVTRFSPEDPAAAESLSRMATSQENEFADVAAALKLAVSVDLSHLPLPSWELPRESASGLTQHQDHSWFFSDRARSAGIHFQYFNSDDPQTEGKRMFETTGGGVAVADFDNNSWPDIYLTQGCRWPAVETQREFADQCFLNSGRGTFQECSKSSGLLEYGYSQGASAGDFDNDGFVDLYVANIGQNRLFRNNGDGTFEEISGTVGVTDDSWTTSCVLADLDGDSLPDLYDANYLSGKETYERVCGTDHPLACSPTAFTGAIQRVFRNRGDGTFDDSTAEFGLEGLRGKALGIVVARMSQPVVPDIVVANDAEANFYFRSREKVSGGSRVFEESAVFSGLAFDRDGHSQACMGIASDDVNGDGMLDFFMTNFDEESNTLYIQEGGGLFIDETREADLRQASMDLLGFGTQFLDGDLDGWPDLVIANGHVVDRSHKGRRYHMRPQYFRNLGSGRFEELTPREENSWFSGEYLGRGLARIDWNRDGREDFVVSNLDSPAALVTNESAGCGSSLIIRLIGVNCSRDAVGTNVTVTSAERSRTRQLTAGDGYQASNERILVFGLADAKAAEEVLIQWPSGTEQSLSNLAADFEYQVIEGRSQAIKIPLESAVRER
jgi:tetratricopeptide (TPR) repeat protein